MSCSRISRNGCSTNQNGNVTRQKWAQTIFNPMISQDTNGCYQPTQEELPHIFAPESQEIQDQ
jgi:hypothetical protein